MLEKEDTSYRGSMYLVFVKPRIGGGSSGEASENGRGVL